MLSFRQLEVFRAVMLSGSISGAAERLNISQPTVTSTLRRFEDVLGVSLFDRSSPRLKPTATAQRVFEVVAPSISSFEKLSDSVLAAARGENARFYLGVSPSVSQRLAPRALRKFANERPDTRLRMDTLSMAQNRDYLWMAEGSATVTIFAIEEAGLVTFPVATIAIVCLLPADHRLAGRDAVSIRDLDREPLVYFHPRTPHLKVIVPMFKAAGIEPQIAIENRFAEASAALVREGFGISLLDGLTGHSVIDPALTVLPLVDSPELLVQMHCRSDFRDEQDVQLMLRSLRAAAAEMGLKSPEGSA